jgi:hypothetical protein
MEVMVSEENIQLILRYVKSDFKFFLINKMFERIYIGLRYNPILSDRIYKISCYEGNIKAIDMLKNRDLISDDEKELLDYWNENRVVRLGEIPFYDFTIEESKFVDKEFGKRLIDHFILLKDNFKGDHNCPNSWGYRGYGVEYKREEYKCFVTLHDHNFGNFLNIECYSTHNKIKCNKFECTIWSISNILQFYNKIDINSLLSKVYIYYDKYITQKDDEIYYEHYPSGDDE